MKRTVVRAGGASAPIVVWLNAEARLVDRVVRLAERRAASLRRGSAGDAADSLCRLRYLEFLHEVLDVEEAA